MTTELRDFVDKARQKGLSDAEISQKLTAEGWPNAQVQAAIAGHDDLEVPKPPTSGLEVPTPPKQYDANNPMPVISNLSTKGFEYSIMFASLWFSTLGLAGLLNSQVGKIIGESSGAGSFDVFWVTILIVFAPIFGLMFLRLKKAEINNPSLLKDPSRKRLSHVTQFATFIAGAIYLIYFVFSLMNGDVGTEYGMSFAELVAHLAVTMAVVGFVFFYYWREEHKNLPPSNLQPDAKI